MVEATHFIDGSQIYGSDEEHAADLRSFRDGRLKSDFYVGQQEFCPQKNRTLKQCDAYPLICFVAGTIIYNFVKMSNKSNWKVSFTIDFLFFVLGDIRVNQSLGIALFQNMFLRFHNIVAYHLHRLNSFWCDEDIYHESRRIVIAVIQHITYTHYLPILMGRH